MRLQKEIKYTIVLNSNEYDILMLALRHVIRFPASPTYSESTMTCINDMLAELDEYE